MYSRGTIGFDCTCRPPFLCPHSSRIFLSINKNRSKWPGIVSTEKQGSAPLSRLRQTGEVHFTPAPRRFIGTSGVTHAPSWRSRRVTGLSSN